MENTTPTPQQPETISSTPPTTAVPSQKQSALKTIVVVQFLVILGLLAAFVYFSQFGIQQATQSDSNTQQIGTNTDTSSEVNSPSNLTGFVKDNEVAVLQADGSIRKVTNTQGNVLSASFSSDHSRVAYIVGQKKELPGGYVDHQPTKIMYNDLESGQTTEVFAMETIYQPNSEYGMMIRDVNIAADGSIIVYSTSDSIYLYDVEQGTSRQVYSAPITDTSARGIVYSYFDLRLSPDNQKLLLKKGFYEGFARITMDLQTGTSYDLPITANGWGSSAEVFWIDNEKLGVVESIDDGSPDGFTSTYYQLSWTGSAKQVIKDTGEYSFQSIFDSKDSPERYAIGGKNLISDQQEGRIDRFFVVVSLNEQTGMITELYSEQLGSEYIEGSTLSSDAKTVFYTKEEIQGSKSELYSFDLVAPNSQPKLLGRNVSLEGSY